MSNSEPKLASLNYRDAGVDAGNQLIERIKPVAKATRRPRVPDSIDSIAYCTV